MIPLDSLLHLSMAGLLGVLRVPFVVVMALSAGKEAADMLGLGTPDWADFLWGVFGALLFCCDSPINYRRKPKC